jgi:Nucleoside 2-deoxyribosyltransferase like
VLHVQALDEYAPGSLPAVFMAGGISGCPDWQREVVGLLRDEPVALLNPRRAAFPIGDPEAGPKQIEWEHRHLRRADAILFWFPRETLCPIALYELGAWSMTTKSLFVGTHPGYPRRMDVEVQTRLARPDVRVADSLTDLAEQVRFWVPTARRAT